MERRDFGKLAASLVALVLTFSSLILSAPSAWAASCEARAHNVHASAHVPGTMNAVVEAVCDFDPPAYLYLDGQVQYLSNGAWLTSSGGSSSLLDDRAEYVRKSLSKSCSGNSPFIVYRSRARYGIGSSRTTATWSGWVASGQSSVNCGSGGGGGGGGWGTGPTTGYSN